MLQKQEVIERERSWIVRRYLEGDEEAVLELMKMCFGDRFDVSDYEHWVWEHKENPLGSRIWVVEHDGQIIGHSSTIPVRMKVGDNVVNGYIGADSATHPNFRRQGVQRAIWDYSRDEAENKEGVFYYFAGEGWGNMKFENEVCRIAVLVKFFDTYETLRERVGYKFLAKPVSLLANCFLGIFYRTKRSPVSENPRITEISWFDERVNVFWEEVSKHFNIITVRTKKYLNWRYFKRPNYKFTVLLAEEGREIQGYIVFLSKDEKGFIVDLLAHSEREDVVQSLISRAVKQLKEEKVNLITCWMMKNNPYYKILRANGFIRHQTKIAFSAQTRGKPEISENFIRDPNNWYLTLGDTDGVFV